jgi:hypothetical protein
MFVSHGKPKSQILVTGLLALVFAIAGTAARSQAGSNPGMDQNGQAVAQAQALPKVALTVLNEFEFEGTGSITSNVFGSACNALACTASAGTCGCLTYSGTGSGDLGSGATWTYNQTTNDDDVVNTGPLTGTFADRCFATEGDGKLTSKGGTNSLKFNASGWACEFGGITFFNIDNTIYLSGGTGTFKNAIGTANLAASAQFSNGNTIMRIDGVVQTTASSSKVK